MKVENRYSPNFGAKLIIDKVYVKKLANLGFIQQNTNFVKLVNWNKNDILALNEIAKWKNDEYAKCINHHVSEGYAADVYVLTTQQNDFSIIDAKKILGVVQITENHVLGCFLDYFQVKPSLKNMGIGHSILNSLKMLYNKISLMPAGKKEVKQFYLRNGFVEYPDDSNFFVWYKDSFERF